LTRSDRNRPTRRWPGYIIGIVVCLAGPIRAEQPGPVDRPFRARADSLRRAGSYDAALAAYLHAHARGLPKDSLFLYWAHLYIDRGIYDSALAVNRAALELERPELRKPLLTQRYVIYHLTGATEQARMVRERLRADSSPAPQPPPPPVRPSLRARLSSGYEGARERTPSLLGDSVHHARVHELRSALSLYPGILIEQAGAAPRHLGAYLRLLDRRGVGREYARHGTDSLSIAGGLTLSWDDILELIGVGIEGGLRRERDRSTRWTGAVSLSATGESLMGAASYSFALTNQGELDNQIGFLTVIFNKPLTAGISLSPSVTAMVYGAQALEVGLPVLALEDNSVVEAEMLYIDKNATSGELVPLFYRDRELSAPLDTAGVNAHISRVAPYADSARHHARTLAIRLSLPVTFVRLGTSLDASIRLGESLRLKSSCGLSADWYPQPVRWTTIDGDRATSYLAYQPGTRTYYAIQDLNRYSGHGHISIGAPVGRDHSERRIDLHLRLGCVLEKRFHRAGTLGLDTRWRLYTTSLSEAAPVTRTLRDVTAGLTWRYDWKAR
jgi:tetratricopeptide (TPR) repeat protein